MANKMTHRDYFNAILSKYPLTDKEKDFVKGRIEALDKKANSVKSKVSEKDEPVNCNFALAVQLIEKNLYQR